MSDDAFISRLPSTLRKIAEMCGLDNALKIGERFGGVNLYIPKPKALMRDIRNARIREEYDSGKYTISDLSRRHRLSIRMISYILKGPDEFSIQSRKKDPDAAKSK